eukprot:g148.t1
MAVHVFCRCVENFLWQEPNAWGGSWGGTSDKCVFADSNRCNGRGAKKESSRSTKLSHGILFDMENGEGQDPQDKAPKRTSWEEIRARAAQQARSCMGT